VRVTTVIVCRNNKETVAAAIESVVSQNYDENEVAVIDNASTDESWEEIQLAGERLACGFSVEQEVSLAFAKNLAVRQMWDNTDLFIFLRPEDEILPYGVGRFAAAVDSGKIGLVYADELHYDVKGRRSHIYKSALIPESAAIGW
jgi:glycosyltransferase involved in cell wall biosynthesis